MRKCKGAEEAKLLDENRILMERIGANLRAIRRAKDLTQLDVAARVEVSKSFVCNLEKGSYNTVTILTLLRITKGLDTDLLSVLH